MKGSLPLTSADYRIVNPAAEKLLVYGGGGTDRPERQSADAESVSREHDGYLANYARPGRLALLGSGARSMGQRKDGTVFPMDLSVSEVQLENRRLFTGFVRDITERKQSEQATGSLAAIVESSGDAIISKNLDGNYWHLESRGAGIVRLLFRRDYWSIHSDHHSPVAARRGTGDFKTNSRKQVESVVMKRFGERKDGQPGGRFADGVADQGCRGEDRRHLQDRAGIFPSGGVWNRKFWKSATARGEKSDIHCTTGYPSILRALS